MFRSELPVKTKYHGLNWSDSSLKFGEFNNLDNKSLQGLTIRLQWFPRVGIHSAEESLMVDPHFGVIDDAGYHSVFRVCARVKLSK